MLSYRHAFHAGMHADVLKHAVLVQLLRYLAQKDKAFWCIDTHAGSASYALRGEHAKRSGEWHTGIGRLWERTDLPEPLRDYVEVVRADDNAGELRYYPGSPWIADHLLRRQDRLRLFELHPTDIAALKKHFRNAAPRVIATEGDGFDGVLSLLPPPSRRGLVLIDPSYEDKRDYRRVVATLKAALERFATGTYMVWYPLITREEARRLPEQLKRIQPSDWVHASLSVKRAPDDGLGIYGSGVFVLNPPYTLPGMLEKMLPWLVSALGEQPGAGFNLESRLS